MCRAFVGICLTDDAKARQDLRNMAMNLMHNGRDKGNTDGYFLASYKDAVEPNIHVRSLEFIASMKNIYNPKEEFGRVFHGHARAANMGGVTEEYIHGWTVGNGEYTCSHNGTIWIDEKENQCANDSKSLFALIDGVYDPNPIVFAKNIKSLVEKVVDGGSGVFFMVSNDSTIGFCFNKRMYLHVLDGKFIEMNSQDDIHTFKDEISYSLEAKMQPEPMKLGLMEFKPDKKREVRISFKTPFGFKESQSTDFEDKIFVMDNATGEVVYLEGFKKIPYGRPQKAWVNEYHNGKNKKGGVQVEIKDGDEKNANEYQHIQDVMGKYMSVRQHLEKELEEENAFMSKQDASNGPMDPTMKELQGCFGTQEALLHDQGTI